MIQKEKNIGLFFGSFNPVHIGHLMLAEYFSQFTSLDQVWFVVSPQNPLKEKKTLLNAHYRLELVYIATKNRTDMKVCDIEFYLPVPSYTINTIFYLKEKYPYYKFCLLMGSDNLVTLHKWKNYEQLLEECSIFVYPRENYKGSKFDNHPSVTFFDAPKIEISSSFIRNAIKQKKSVEFFLHPEVWKYIKEMHFYEK